jgi:hypothetical protein
MVIAGILLWWYGPGWRGRALSLRDKLAGTMDYFSIDLLLRTLFSPYRQISAGKVRGPLGVQMRAMMDRFISRIIGAMIRFTMIIIGSFAIIFYALIGLVMLVVWAVVPVLPVIGLLLFLAGWMPWI